ncbi:MAG: hypothetical protein VZR73_13860, partial [Acutalibacteraceae bacterium]|nr:hypothetical protein [Acutalibacteraceae bacterium]
YLDTFDHKGPVIYLLDFLGLSLNQKIGVWIVELCFILIALIYSYKLAVLFGAGKRISLVAALVCALSLTYYFEGGNQVEEYACTCILISLYIFAKYFIKKSVRWYDLLLCGITCAMVCLLRINMAALWVVMCIGVSIDCIRNKKVKQMLIYLVWFVVGMAIVTLPIVIWLVNGGAWKAFLEDYFLFNFKYSSDGERASFTMFLQALVRFCRGIPVILGAAFLFHYALDRKRLFEWLCVTALALSLVTMCISGQSYGHYGMVLCPLITCAFAMALGEITQKEPGREVFVTIGEKEKKYRIIVIKVIVLTALLFLISLNRPAVATEFDAGLPEIAEVIRANSTEDERIIVCGNRDCVYLQARRKSASLYSYQDPIAEVDPDIKEAFLQDVRSLEAKLIVISTTSSWNNEIKDVLESRYELVKSVNGTEIYRRK